MTNPHPKAGRSDPADEIGTPESDADTTADIGADIGAETPDKAAESWEISGLENQDDEAARLAEEVADLRDKLLRALAEVENVRKRAAREKEDTAKFGVSRFARDLLSVADNLRRALEAAPDDRADDEATISLIAGVAATERELLAAFDRHGLAKVEPLDEKFDPNFHEAAFQVPNSGKLPGTVVQVVQPGYVLHGRLLRPAMVGVAVGDAPAKVDTSA
ncbi:MAG: nucleotide exchange factor GrpE [Inquilinaceae bacterium]